jgi:hypothetical protein
MPDVLGGLFEWLGNFRNLQDSLSTVFVSIPGRFAGRTSPLADYAGESRRIWPLSHQRRRGADVAVRSPLCSRGALGLEQRNRTHAGWFCLEQFFRETAWRSLAPPLPRKERSATNLKGWESTSDPIRYARRQVRVFVYCDLSNTISPPITVMVQVVVRISGAGIFIMSFERIVRSASLPTSMEPLSCSSKAA